MDRLDRLVQSLDPSQGEPAGPIGHAPKRLLDQLEDSQALGDDEGREQHRRTGEAEGEAGNAASAQVGARKQGEAREGEEKLGRNFGGQIDHHGCSRPVAAQALEREHARADDFAADVAEREQTIGALADPADAHEAEDGARSTAADQRAPAERAEEKLCCMDENEG